jgi:hypothetical protein
MIVSDFIEWLKTMPQDARVSVLTHESGRSYYDQGGNCSPCDFTPNVDYTFDNGLTVFGEHFEVSTYQNETTLQLGLMNQ